ncbi:hypothetical protein ASPTUDRAFT_45296 [Aspergillus tubingensis CBS 134.48]|uniref:Uncharacterized protein n=1 Tax=Aspergillus tubingensis (strain CBS 134.48) TaxID=767770 RepID=A0A1L9MY51_ASPTC|nr:hypothetical protein ASPTUDRAFT_45296 [Aspergillus tubingensis CBS 134.48]
MMQKRWERFFLLACLLACLLAYFSRCRTGLLLTVGIDCYQGIYFDSEVSPVSVVIWGPLI